MKVKPNNRLIFWVVLLAGVLLGIGQTMASYAGTGPQSLVINEVMAANQSGLRDEDGDPSDWVELHNAGTSAINLAGWLLTDSRDQPQKWPLPDLTLAAGDYLLIFASGKNRTITGADRPLHTNFKLGREGEFLGLYNTLEQTMTPLQPSPHFRDVAFGRQADSGPYGYLANATPGQPNDADLLWQGVLAPVGFGVQRGFYQTPFTLALSSPSPTATIRYTLDGSAPTATHGLTYRDPIPISQTTTVRAAAFRPNYRPAPVATHSYIFLNEVLRQPSTPPEGFPATWGVYRQTYKVAVEGEPVPTNYNMDPDIVTDPRYRDTLTGDLQSIPSLFVTIDRADFDIYVNPRERGRAWERPAAVELFDPSQPEAGFQVNAGLRIQGDLGREEYIPKHSFRLFFRDEYGPTHLEYPLFPDSPVERFDSVILRGGVQSSYSSVWDNRRRDTTYTRDEWLRASQIEMSGLGSHGIFVHLYLNGLYWGLYNVVERPDHDFAAAYLNIKPEAWYAFNHSGFVNGPEEAVQQLLTTFAEAGSLAEKIDIAKRRLDATAFADYVILNWYAGTGDWPNNNWYAGYHHPDGKIHYFVWDGELTWRSGAKISFGISNPPGYFFPNTVEPFFKALIQDPDFKLLFADRLYHHLFNDGALTAANARQRWLTINQRIERAIVAESARWGDTRQEPPLDREDWLAAVDNVLAQMEGNPEKLLHLARGQGYYPPLDPPDFNHPGGRIEPDFNLAMAAPTGDIFFTTDGADPRLPGSGDSSPAAHRYVGPVPLTRTTIIKARVRQDDAWSALRQAEFTAQAMPNQPLRLTEIMYNPPGPDNLEFIALHNSSDRALNLAGMTFSEGIEFIFPANSLLPAGEHLLLVGNAQAFAARYPGVDIGGEFQGQLANQGETLTLRRPGGAVVLSVAYSDDNGWPISPDGRGDSLVLVDMDGDPNQPKSWRASLTLAGSPGAATQP